MYLCDIIIPENEWASADTGALISKEGRQCPTEKDLQGRSVHHHFSCGSSSRSDPCQQTETPLQLSRPELTDQTYCEKHRSCPKEYDKFSEPDVNQKYGRAWKRIRDRSLTAPALSFAQQGAHVAVEKYIASSRREGGTATKTSCPLPELPHPHPPS